MKIMSSLYFGLAVALLSSGCGSFRVKTDLLPETDANLKSTAGMFYVAGLKYHCEEGARKTDFVQAYYDDLGKDLLRHLRKQCSDQYPLLFTEEESAIPLYVTLSDVVDLYQLKGFTWAVCTLFITPFILPQPQDKDHNLTVSVSVWNGKDGKGSVAVQKKFRREERGWGTMFTPLGLIPFPGESDFPKQSFSEFNDDHRRLNDHPQIAQQVATALAKMIESKEPEFWTTAPRRTQQPGYAPVPASQSAPMPLPTEPIQPF